MAPDAARGGGRRGALPALLVPIAILLVFACVSAARAETRVALVIGNSTYAASPRLNNPGRDAAGVADALRRAGFSTVTLRVNADHAQMRASLQAFARVAAGADVAAVYFAGHGLELGGVNYLVPVDARLTTDADVAYEAVPLGLVMDAVGGARRLGLVMLDACRNNPFAAQMAVRRGAQRSIGRGLAKVEPASNTLVVYAARDGTTAADGDGQNSPFAQSLMLRLPAPGVEIGLMFRQVRDDVLEATGGAQQPFTYGSLGGASYYLAGGPAPTPAGRPPADRPASSPQVAPDVARPSSPDFRPLTPSAERGGVKVRLVSLVTRRDAEGQPGYAATLELGNDTDSDVGVAVQVDGNVRPQIRLNDDEGGECQLQLGNVQGQTTNLAMLSLETFAGDRSTATMIPPGGASRHVLRFTERNCSAPLVARDGLSLAGSLVVVKDGRRSLFPFSFRELSLTSQRR